MRYQKTHLYLVTGVKAFSVEKNVRKQKKKKKKKIHFTVKPLKSSLCSETKTKNGIISKSSDTYESCIRSTPSPLNVCVDINRPRTRQIRFAVLLVKQFFFFFFFFVSASTTAAVFHSSITFRIGFVLNPYECARVAIVKKEICSIFHSSGDRPNINRQNLFRNVSWKKIIVLYRSTRPSVCMYTVFWTKRVVKI